MAKKSVIYRNIVYTRYEGRLYYNPNGSYLHKGYTSLHRQIYLDAGNEIPEGYHVHHISGDHDDNRIENLTCLPKGKHLSGHIKERLNAGLGEQLKEWRDSEEGKRILRDNARKMRERTPTRQCTCGYCGKSFETSNSCRLYCSDFCAEKAGERQIKKTCPMCGKEFWTKRNTKKETQTCSCNCGWALRREKARLQHNSS